MARGRCLCGAVTIDIAGEPIGVRTCWCRVCQYLGAGSATVNVIFAAGDVSVQGEMVDYVSIADSGNVMHRRFCPACGTALLSASEARPDLVVVRAGALDERDHCRPGMTIWTREAPVWACFDPGVPCVEAQPAPVR
jgi:hypothetical protein